MAQFHCEDWRAAINASVGTYSRNIDFDQCSDVVPTWRGSNAQIGFDDFDDRYRFNRRTRLGSEI
jgi:hypothetical protein